MGGGRGWSPAKPWASPKFALEGDKICKGARVIIAPGSYDAGSIQPGWNNNPNQGTGDVVIEGAGRDSSILYNTASIQNNYLLYGDPTNGNVIYKSLKLYSTQVLPNEMNLIYQQPGSKVQFWDCTLGDSNYQVSYIKHRSI